LKEQTVNFAVTITIFKEICTEFVVSLSLMAKEVHSRAFPLLVVKQRVEYGCRAETTGFVNVVADLEDDEIMQDNRKIYQHVYPQGSPCNYFR